MVGKNHFKFSLYIVCLALVLGFFISNNTLPAMPTAKAAECGNKYSSDVQSAINDVLAQNSSVGSANNCSTGSINTLLNGVVTTLRGRGFLAGRVFRAGVNGLSDDKILVARSGDAEGEMYDVIASVGDSTKTIGSSVVTQCADSAPISQFREPGDAPPVECVNPTDPTDPTDPTGPADPTDPDVIPPDLSSDGVTAMSGKNPSLAFNPVKRLWLVVAENAGRIQGQLMTERNKPSGSLINIGSGVTPKVAYGANGNTFLVVWTSNKTLSGLFLNSDGIPSGSPFSIASGGAKLYSQSSLQYDSGNQRFVIAYEKDGAGTDIAIAMISSNGALPTPALLAKGINNSESEPTITVNRKKNLYCSTYVDGSRLMVQSVSANGVVGVASQISTAEHNVGIGYSPATDEYLAIWIRDNNIYSKTLSTCADNPEDEDNKIGIESSKAVLANNSSTFGLFYLKNTDNMDIFATLNSSGNGTGAVDQKVFSGKITLNTFFPAVAPNSLTDQYALANSDGSTVKFVTGGGLSDSNQSSTGTIPGSINFGIPSEGLPTDLGQLIEAIFNWALTIIGFVIFVRFFYAGFKWFTAAGSAPAISEARSMMWNAVYGAIVLFSAYLILNTINPDLVHNTFNLSGVPNSQQKDSSPTSCLSNSGGTYTSRVTEFENVVLQDQPAFNTAPNTPENREQFT
ncbi:MAG: pilin, partial [Patescibacteria group bacterium]